MAWIKFEKDLLTDPRVLRIARSLEARWLLFDGPDSRNAAALPAVTLVCGALVRIWSLADTHLGEDDLLPLGIEELERVVGVPGFCSLLPPDWLLVVDEHAVKLPDFHKHNGTEAKKKAVTQKRVARHRQALHPSNARALPDQTRPRPDQKLSTKGGLAPPPRAPGGRKVNGNGAFSAEAENVLAYLNNATGRDFRFRNPAGDLTPNAEVIVARLKEGYTGVQLREVVMLKAEKWRGDEKMDEFLRPSTLFGKTKFAQYIGELEPATP